VGTFDLHIVGTVIEHDLRQYAIGSPFLDYVGFPADGGEAKTKANATLTWEYRQWTLGWATTYFGSYLQLGSPGDPFVFQNGPLTFFTAAQGGYTIPSQTYHQIFATYVTGDTRFLHGLFSNVAVQAGIKNLFNTSPPFDAFYQPYFYSPYGDPRLRDYWVSVKKAF
jgi:hypothetical protein